MFAVDKHDELVERRPHTVNKSPDWPNAAAVTVATTTSSLCDSVIVLQVTCTSCARGDTICPARCTPDAAAQLQPIPYACGAQRALHPISVGSMNINELMNINDVRESATIFPRPCKLTFDLLTLKLVSDHVWRGLLCTNFGLPPLCSRVIPDVHYRQTDRRQTASSLNAPA